MPHRRILPLVILAVAPAVFVVRDVFASVALVTTRIVQFVVDDTWGPTKGMYQ